MSKINLLCIVLLAVFLSACSGGGGGSDGGGSVDPQAELPVGFSKSTADFTQYEAIVLETDECHQVFDVFLGEEYISSQTLGDGSLMLEMPSTYEPGNYNLRVTLENSCVTTGLPEDIYSDIILNFDLQAAITTADPGFYLEERINDALGLVDEMLLSETDVDLLAYLTQLRTDLESQLTALPTMTSTDTENAALMLLNNTADLSTLDLSTLPTGFSILDIYTCEGTLAPGDQVLTRCRFNWLVMSAAGFYINATHNPVGALVCAASFVYHLRAFKAETRDNDLWTDIKTELQDDSGVTYLENEYDTLLGDYDTLPAGLVLAADNSLIFTENFAQTIMVKNTKSVKAADKDIIQTIKDTILKVAAFLPDPLPGQIAALNYEDKVEYVADMSTYLIPDNLISDERLEVATTSTGDKLTISFTPKVGAVILNQFPFTFALTDPAGQEFTFNSSWSPALPLPQANDMNFWYDFSGIGLIHGVVDSYEIPSWSKTRYGGLRINANFAETVEIVRPPQYLLPYDGVNYLTVVPGDGIANNEVALNIYTSSFNNLPDGVMSDSLQYRVRNASGVSPIRTLYFGSKYSDVDRQYLSPLDLTNSLPPIFLEGESPGVKFPLLVPAENVIDPDYSLYLEITPQYDYLTATGNYIVQLLVEDSATGQGLYDMAVPEQINLHLWHENGSDLIVIDDGAGGAFPNSDLTNKPEMYIGDPSYAIVTPDELNTRLAMSVSQSWYAQCKYPPALWDYYQNYADEPYYQIYCLGIAP